jgi:Protein of unknown function (DUF2933)
MNDMEGRMPIHEHAQHHQSDLREGSFWTSRAFLVCAVLVVIVGFLLWTEHLAHALGYLPYLLILACPLMHIFMHGGHGHGGHGGHADQQRTDRDRKSSDGERS